MSEGDAGGAAGGMGSVPAGAEANPAVTPTDTNGGSDAGQSNPAEENQGGGKAEAGSEGGKNFEAPQPAGDAETKPEANEWLGAPEGMYNADGIELGEGQEVNGDIANGLAGVCRELGLSQKAFSAIINKMSPVIEKAQQAQVAQFRNDNLAALRADKELGGAKTEETIRTAAAAYRRFCPEDTRKMLEQAGLDSHPGIVRMFYQIAQAISDDVSPRGAGGGAKGVDLKRFFNNSQMN